MNNISLIATSGDNLDHRIVASARTSYAGVSKGREQDERLLRYLIKHEHSSPLEMVDYVFDAEMDYPEWLALQDNRFRSFIFHYDRSNLYKGLIRLDLNNAMKAYRILPETHLLRAALQDAIIHHNPVVAVEMGLVDFGPMTMPDPDMPAYIARTEVEYDHSVELLDSIPPLKIARAIGYTEQDIADNPGFLGIPVTRYRINTSVVVWWQMVRHRSMSANLQSGRYTPFEEDQFIKWFEWRKQSSTNKQGSDGSYGDLYDQAIQTKNLLDVIDMGYGFYKDALNRGIAKEQARFYLPGWISMYTGLVKFDTLALQNFFRLRTAPEAQHEIRVIAAAMEDQHSTHLRYLEHLGE